MQRLEVAPWLPEIAGNEGEHVRRAVGRIRAGKCASQLGPSQRGAGMVQAGKTAEEWDALPVNTPFMLLALSFPASAS